MWTVLVLTNLLGLTCTVASFPPCPINVTFSSVNLRNVLHWLPGHDTPNDTHFTVQYAIYGESVDEGKQLKWRKAHHCTAIMRTWCDLSAQTSDLDHGYYARVRSVAQRMSSKWTVLQRRFDPKEETSLGPPLVSVEVHNNTATITVKGPMRYQLNNQTPAISMAKIYKRMTYNLSVHNTNLNQMHHYVVEKGLFKYSLLSYNTKYCFSAQSRLLLMPIECQRSAWYCITTAQDPLIEQLQRVVVGIVVPFLLICVIVVAGFMLYQYMAGKGQQYPFLLEPSFYPPPLVPFPDQYNNVCLFDKSNIIIKEPPPYPQDLLLLSPPLGYSPQRPAQPEELPYDSSVDYGAVFVPREHDKDIGREHWTGEANLTGEGHSSAASNKKGKSTVEGDLSYLPQRPSDVCVVPPAYASQNPGNLPTSHLYPSDCHHVVKPDDVIQKSEAEDGEGVPFLSKMSVESRRLQLQSREERNLDEATALQNGREERETGNQLEPYVIKSAINLFLDMFFKQNSETDWAQEELEGDGSDDNLAKWNLTFSTG